MRTWIGPYTPTRMPADGNTYLYYDFAGATPPFTNKGVGGLPLQNAGGLGTGYGFARGPLFGGDAVYVTEAASLGALRVDGTSPPAVTGLTFACWVTISNYYPLSTQGLLWFKSWFPTSWTNPYLWGLGFNLVGGQPTVSFWYITGGVLKEFRVSADLLMPLNSVLLVGATYDGANVKIWVNGVEVASVAETGSFTLGTGPWGIGGHNSGGTSPLGGITGNNKMSGIIEEVRFDTVARDAAWWQENWERGMGVI